MILHKASRKEEVIWTDNISQICTYTTGMVVLNFSSGRPSSCSNTKHSNPVQLSCWLLDVMLRKYESTSASTLSNFLSVFS